MGGGGGKPLLGDYNPRVATNTSYKFIIHSLSFFEAFPLMGFGLVWAVTSINELSVGTSEQQYCFKKSFCSMKCDPDIEGSATRNIYQ